MNKATLAEEPEDEPLYGDDYDDDDSMDRARVPVATPLLDRGKADHETMVEVSVRIWLTKGFIDMEEDVQGYIDTCFEEANACLANSLVPLRLRHFGTKVYEGKEIYDLHEFIKTWRSDAAKNATTRNAILNTADTAAMLTGRSEPVGVGYYPPKNRDTVKIPFAIINHMGARYGIYALCDRFIV